MFNTSYVVKILDGFNIASFDRLAILTTHRQLKSEHRLDSRCASVNSQGDVWRVCSRWLVDERHTDKGALVAFMLTVSQAPLLAVQLASRTVARQLSTSKFQRDDWTPWACTRPSWPRHSSSSRVRESTLRSSNTVRNPFLATIRFDYNALLILKNNRSKKETSERTMIQSWLGGVRCDSTRDWRRRFVVMKRSMVSGRQRRQWGCWASSPGEEAAPLLGSRGRCRICLDHRRWRSDGHHRKSLC